MKRVDILKDVEQFLVQKAYETGHISHHTDGDWQKQADGSWIPYKGQSTQSTPQTRQPAPTENTKYGEITEEDLVKTPEFDSNEDREFDSLQKSIIKMYNTGTLKDDISQIPADSSGSSPDEKEVREFVNGLLRTHGMSRSRLITDHLDALEEQITDLWHKGQVGKSAVRDMRSTLTVKNMGF